MIIDAMDILHSKLVNAFCLVSSDSDYTGLANRIREEGIFVMGVGQAKTPDAFVKACELFIYTENLTPDENVPDLAKRQTRSRKKALVSASNESTDLYQKDIAEVKDTEYATEEKRQEKNYIKNKITKKPLEIRLIDSAFDMVKQDDESAYLGAIGEALRRLDSSFDPRTFGFNSLTSLFKSLSDKYHLEYRNNGTSVYIKQKV